MSHANQVQGVFVILVNIFFAIFMAVYFKLDTSIPLPDYLGAGADGGGGTLVSIAFSMISFTVFAESLWQKSWAAKTEKELKKAAVIACFTVNIIVFLFGFYGFMMAWNGLVPVTYNLQMFSIFVDNRPTWILTILMCLCIIMSESTIDSYQIAITSSISTFFFKDKPLWWTQLVLIIINIPIIVISLQNLDLTGIYLSEGLIATSGMGVLFLGMIPALEKYHKSINVILGSLLGIFFSAVWACYQKDTISEGLLYLFYSYWGWQSYTIIFLSSIGVSLVISFGLYLLEKIFHINLEKKEEKPSNEKNFELVKNGTTSPDLGKIVFKILINYYLAVDKDNMIIYPEIADKI